MTSQKHGVSALGVQRSLGLGSYQTAWAMLHRYRAAMVRPGRERLAGHVEVDEGYVGGVEGGVGGRRPRPRRSSRSLWRSRVPGDSGGSGSSMCPTSPPIACCRSWTRRSSPARPSTPTGGRRIGKLPERGYDHERTVMRQQSDPAHVVIPGVHRVASLLQRWLLGAHHGRVSHEHLDAYLNEVPFRFRPQLAASRAPVYRLLEHAVVADPITTAASSSTGPPPAADRRAHQDPGRVADVPAVDRPWRQNTAATGLPD